MFIKNSLILFMVINFTINKVLAFIPKEENTIAVSCGDNKFYRDNSLKILYKPDTYRQGGKIAKKEDTKFIQRKTIFDENYDWNIHKTYVYDLQYFSYILPIKKSGEYSLIMVFTELGDIGQNKRLFNVLIEDEVVIPLLDIYQLSGGKQNPYYEIVELSFQNRVLRNKSKDQVIKTYNQTYQNLNVTFQSVVGSAKLDAIILFEGQFSDIKKYMVELFMDKSNKGQGLKMNQLRIFLQGNSITCQSDKDYVFPLRQYFVKKINEQQMQSCSQNIIVQQIQPKSKHQQEIEEKELKDRRKQNSQQMHNSRKQSIRKNQEILEYIKENGSNLILFFKQNIFFLSSLLIHYIVIGYLFRERNRDKNYHSKHPKYSNQQISIKETVEANNLQQDTILQAQQKVNQFKDKEQQ